MNPQLYIWLKVIHLVMVMAWMVSIFYLPRILVHVVEARAAGPIGGPAFHHGAQTV